MPDAWVQNPRLTVISRFHIKGNVQTYIFPLFPFSEHEDRLRRSEGLGMLFWKGGITIPVFVGVLPLVSARNAEFLHNEVPGIIIPEPVRRRIAAFTEPEDQRRAAREMAVELTQRLAVLTRDFYFIAPRNRVEWVLPLIGCVRENQHEDMKGVYA